MYYTIDLAVSGEKNPVFKWLAFKEEHRRNKVLKRLLAMFVQGPITVKKTGQAINYGNISICFEFESGDVFEEINSLLQDLLTEEEYRLNERNVNSPYILLWKGYTHDPKVMDLVYKHYDFKTMNCDVLLKGVLD